MRSADRTAPERSGWRDLELSRRHRTWGVNCPAVDLDFLMVEYNLGEPVALVEYKHWRAKPVDLRHPTYRAIRALGDEAGLPFVLAFYWPASWSFYVYPVNERARRVYCNEDRRRLSERRFVASLYHLRSLKVADSVLARLNDQPLADDAALPSILDEERAA